MRYKNKDELRKNLSRAIVNYSVLIDECCRSDDAELAIHILNEINKLVLKAISKVNSDPEDYKFYFENPDDSFTEIDDEPEYKMRFYPNHFYNFYTKALKSAKKEDSEIIREIVYSLVNIIHRSNRAYLNIVNENLKSRSNNPFVGEIESLILLFVRISITVQNYLNNESDDSNYLNISSSVHWYINIFNTPFSFVDIRLMETFNYYFIESLQYVIKSERDELFLNIIDDLSKQAFFYRVFGNARISNSLNFQDQVKYEIFEKVPFNPEYLSIYSRRDFEQYVSKVENHFKSFQDLGEVVEAIKSGALYSYYYNQFSTCIIHVGAFILKEKRFDLMNNWIRLYHNPKNISSRMTNNLFPNNLQLQYLFKNLYAIRSAHPFQWNNNDKEFYIDEFFAILIACDNRFFDLFQNTIDSVQRRNLNDLEYYLGLVFNASIRLSEAKLPDYVALDKLQSNIDTARAKIEVKKISNLNIDTKKWIKFKKNIIKRIYFQEGVISIYQSLGLIEGVEPKSAESFKFVELFQKEMFLKDDDILSNHSSDLSILENVFSHNLIAKLTSLYFALLDKKIEALKLTQEESNTLLNDLLNENYVILSNHIRFGFGVFNRNDLEFSYERSTKELYFAKWKPKNVRIYSIGRYFQGSFMVAIESNRMGKIYLKIEDFEYDDKIEPINMMQISCTVKYAFSFSDVQGKFIYIK